MASHQQQIRRDSAANIAAATGAAGEIWWDTTNERVVGNNGSTAGGIWLPNYRDLRNQAFVYAAGGGSANAHTITYSPAMTGYVAGQVFVFKAGATNTGSATLNVDGLGAKTFKKMSGGALVNLEAGDIVSGTIYKCMYDGTDMQLLNPSVQASSGGFDLLSTQTASSSASLSFTSVITSDYASYLFTFHNLRPATNNVGFIMRTSTDNGSSYASSNGDYVTSMEYISNFVTGAGTVSIAGSSAANSTSAKVFLVGDGSFGGAADSLGNVAGEGVSGGKLWLHNPLDTSYEKYMEFDCGCISGVGTRFRTWGRAMRDNPADIDAVQFLMTSGNIASGTIRCYGLKAA